MSCARGVAGPDTCVSHAEAPKWRHAECAGIKHVPERTHAVLRRRAAPAHQSLQEYLRARLIEEANSPTVDAVLDRTGGRAGGSMAAELGSHSLT